jgi:hypothetical protein
MYDHGPHIVQKSGRDSWNGNTGIARFLQRQGAYLVKMTSEPVFVSWYSGSSWSCKQDPVDILISWH